MRLIHVTTVDDSLLFFTGQVGYMQARGIEVAMACSPGAYAERFEREQGVKVFGVPMARRITPFRDLRAIGRLVRLFRRLQPDIVHAHTPKGGLLGTIAAFLAGVPTRIYHIRGLPVLEASGRRRLLLSVAERTACRLATRVLCVSASNRDAAVAAGFCDPDKIRVLANGTGNGVDAARFDRRLQHQAGLDVREALGIAADAAVVLAVGRMVRDKGIDDLAVAWAEIRERRPDAHLILLGSFEPEDPVAPATRERLSADARVHLCGWSNPAPYYAAADVVAFPSYREGFPNVPLEAAAMRLPVVAARVLGSVDAVVDGETGTLIAAADPRALAAALLRYLNDPALAAGHGEAGRRRVLERFQPATVWAALHREYLELAGERRAAADSPQRPATARGVDAAASGGAPAPARNAAQPPLRGGR